MNKIKTLFIGTSEFAVPTLARLLQRESIDLVGVVTQPDKPAGRKQELKPSPVKEYLQKNNLRINLEQPESIKSESESLLKKYQPELIIVASYGQFIPQNILDYPKFKCLNLHGSILPDLRGAVPMPMAIIKGYKETGVTLQIMEMSMDTGDILGIKKCDITNDETTVTLTLKLSNLAADLIEEIIPKWIEGKIQSVKQDESKATYCYMKDISKENAQINWAESAVEIDRKIRGFNPWPIAWTTLRSPEDEDYEKYLEANPKFKGQKFKIYKARVSNAVKVSKKGPKLFKNGKSLALRCDVGWLEILECQLEGKSMASGKDYLYLASDTTNRVRGILINTKNEILLIERKKKGQHFWALPGGAVGVSESETEALVREFLEETNQEIEVGEFLYEFPDTDGVSKHRIYKVNLKSEKEININGEESRYDPELNSYKPMWIKVEDALKLGIASELRSYLTQK